MLKITNNLLQRKKREKSPRKFIAGFFFFQFFFSAQISICHKNMKLNLSSVHILI